jgi:hypothetical protein
MLERIGADLSFDEGENLTPLLIDTEKSIEEHPRILAFQGIAANHAQSHSNVSDFHQLT